eukprot:g4665.t1
MGERPVKFRSNFGTSFGGTKRAAAVAVIFLLASILTVMGIADLEKLCNGIDASSMSVCKAVYSVPFSSTTHISMWRFCRWSSVFQTFVVVFFEFLVMFRKLTEMKVALLVSLGASTVLITVSTIGLADYMMIWGARTTAVGLALHTMINAFLIFRIETLTDLMFQTSNGEDKDENETLDKATNTDTKEACHVIAMEASSV